MFSRKWNEVLASTAYIIYIPKTFTNMGYGGIFKNWKDTLKERNKLLLKLRFLWNARKFDYMRRISCRPCTSTGWLACQRAHLKVQIYCAFEGSLKESIALIFRSKVKDSDSVAPYLFDSAEGVRRRDSSASI